MSIILHLKGHAILELRNNSEVRMLLADLISVLTLSRKRKLETLPKIKKEDFIVNIFKSKLEHIIHVLFQRKILPSTSSSF